jgi:hypothetical protein
MKILKFLEFKMTFGGAIEVPIKQLKEIFQFGNHWDGKKNFALQNSFDVPYNRCQSSKMLVGFSKKQ